MNIKFDIFDFINSSAIAAHCRSIKHHFSALDTAYLIWASEKHSISEKHTAWHTLINTIPDTEVSERPWTPRIKSLHAFLLRFMELENKYISMFFQDEPNCTYSYSIWYPGDGEYSHDMCLFPNFEMCFDAVQYDIANTVEINGNTLRYIRVKKQWLNHTCDEAAKYITVFIDSDGEPWHMCENHAIMPQGDREKLEAFKGMWPEIPTPFKRGDILTFQNRYHRKKEPFILNAIPYWDGAVHERTLAHLRKRGDESDLSANIYRLSDDGTVCRGHGPCYLDMEYYNAELRDSDRFLAFLGSFLKGEYDAAVLLEAYDCLKNERRRKISREYLQKAFSENTAADDVP